jgi:hypothetical protein
MGPNRTLTAHRLAFAQTDPQDIVVGTELTWPMALEGYPLHVGLTVQSKDTVQGSAFMAYAGNFHATVKAPGNVQVMLYDQTCTLVFLECGFALLGQQSFSGASELLDEHLLPGTYTASVTMDGGRDMQAYSWAVTIQ